MFHLTYYVLSFISLHTLQQKFCVHVQSPIGKLILIKLITVISGEENNCEKSSFGSFLHSRLLLLLSYPPQHYVLINPLLFIA